MRIGSLINKATTPFFSFEFFPPGKEADLPAFYEAASELAALAPLFVSVTYGAGGAKQKNTVSVAKSLAELGLETMTHLTCVGAEPYAINEFLKELSANGIGNVLALRGDAPKGEPWNWANSAFRHAIDLVRHIKKEHPEMGIGVAAYPAPHPEARSFAEDRDHTAAKLEAGADFAISQLFFDPREYFDLVENLGKRGIHKPVIPGIMPIQSFESLRRVLSLCGARIPAKLYLELEEANTKGGAEAVRETGIKFAIGQIRQLLDFGAPGIHLYTLNKSGLSGRILKEAGLA